LIVILIIIWSFGFGHLGSISVRLSRWLVHTR
jgi:hypothetical protein